MPPAGYRSDLLEFAKWLDDITDGRGIGVISNQDMDDSVTTFLHYLYDRGNCTGKYKQKGRNIVYGIEAVIHCKLPKSRRAIKTWHKLQPSIPHCCISFPYCCLLAYEMMKYGNLGIVAGFQILVYFGTLCRAEELGGLKTEHVALAGEARAGLAVTGSPRHYLFLPHTKNGLAQTRTIIDEALIEPFSFWVQWCRASGLTKVFLPERICRDILHKAANSLGFPWVVNLHGFRHGGAGHDYLRYGAEHTLERGGWRSNDSMRHYIRQLPGWSAQNKPLDPAAEAFAMQLASGFWQHLILPRLASAMVPATADQMRKYG